MQPLPWDDLSEDFLFLPFFGKEVNSSNTAPTICVGVLFPSVYFFDTIIVVMDGRTRKLPISATTRYIHKRGRCKLQVRAKNKHRLIRRCMPGTYGREYYCTKYLAS